jgi:hypothetical protein
MAVEQWQPREEQTKREKFFLKRLGRTRKLFAFLRLYRRRIFNDGMQRELESMYRVVDLRWQMVLDVLGAVEPAFSQGAFQEFRQRLIKTDMDRRILERTAEVARETGAYDPRKLPKTLR